MVPLRRRGAARSQSVIAGTSRGTIARRICASLLYLAVQSPARLSVKTVYMAYPYSDDPTAHRTEITGIVERLKAARPDLIPFVPHLAFDGFEKFGREYAMKCA